MSEAIGKQFIYNDKVMDVVHFSRYENLLEKTTSVYEVIRVEEGVPLFIEDYLFRFENSYALLKKEIPVSLSKIKATVQKLNQINQHNSGPVKLVFGAGSTDYFLAFIMKPHVPSVKEYKSGVRTISVEATRNNPNLKLWNKNFREQSIRLLEENQAYETILVNPEGFITEASRSNVFFIKDSKVFTTPVDLVLPGITRKKVLEVCGNNHIDVEFEKIAYKKIHLYESCFLTGTARKIVPIRSIDKMTFKVDTDMLNAISGYFEDYVASYLSAHR